MEVYLNSKDENLRFPVVPSVIGKNVNADISGEKIIRKGTVNIFNGSESDSGSLSSFFPGASSTNSYIDVVGQDPYDYVNKIEKWCKTGERLRYIVTETPINIPVRISHFEYSERDGSGDVYYSIELKEDVDIEIVAWTPPTAKSSNVTVINKPRNTVVSTSKNNKVYSVKKGDYLYKIAKKYYGDGSKYKKIKNHPENIKKYPSLKKSNMIYVNWKLVIP